MCVTTYAYLRIDPGAFKECTLTNMGIIMKNVI